MLGAVIGDTVGSVYEFANTKDYNFTLLTRWSIYTDDTVMSMAVARWLIEDPEHTPERLVETMVEMGHRYPKPEGGYGGYFAHWLSLPDGERCPYYSWGNGSAMRVSAVGWFFDTLEETERVAGISAAVTHNHPEGIKGAQATAAAIFLARKGKSKEEIRAYIEERFGYDLSDTWKHLNETYEWDSSCQGTVPQAIVCFLESTDFEDAIRKAVSIGGDSDTLACITGGIAEAYYKEIPRQLRDEVVSRLPEEFKELLARIR